MADPYRYWLTPFNPFMDDDGIPFCERFTTYYALCGHTEDETRCHSETNHARVLRAARRAGRPIPNLKLSAAALTPTTAASPLCTSPTSSRLLHSLGAQAR
jgi:hypothetical protein